MFGRHLPGRVVRLLVALFSLLIILQRNAEAQFPPDSVIELTPAKLDALDGAEQKHLDRAEFLFADRQWEEGIATLRQLVDTLGDKLIEVPDPSSGFAEIHRYVTLRTYVTWRVSSLPQEALAIYRRQLDAQAEQALSSALANHSQAALQAVVDDYLCTSAGDDALLALGDMALHEGDFDAARAAWRRVLPLPPRFLAAYDELITQSFFEIPENVFVRCRNLQGLPAELAALLDSAYESINDGADEPSEFVIRRLNDHVSLDDQITLARFWKSQGVITDLTYPDTSLAEETVHARLVLASILQRDFDRAGWELEQFRAAFPNARGTIAGREGTYTDLLREILVQTTDAAPPREREHWTTFGGSPARQTAVSGEIDIRGPLWQRELSSVFTQAVHQDLPVRDKRPGEGVGRALSYFPVVWNDALLVNDATRIYVFRLEDGEPYWPTAGAREPGEIYRDTSTNPILVRQGYFGAPRYTLTVHQDKLFARMGTPITDRHRKGQERLATSEEQGFLICLDLARGGKLLWEIQPDGRDWAFEGTPVTDGRRLWVGMRQGNLEPEANIACFDVETRRMLWRTPICSGNTPARFLSNVKGEMTHNLLTLDHGTLYYNTNLGCVAAVDAASGRVRWITAYEREPNAGETEPRTEIVHVYRDLNPCLVNAGKVYFAPADNARIFALDASNGKLHWLSVRDSPEDATSLLGVSEGNLIAAGDRVWWFRADGGRFLNRWPESETLDPPGFGRGLLVGNEIYWPTREALHVLSQSEPGPARQPIHLPERSVTGGGNLIVSGEYVIMVSPDLSRGVQTDRLYVFRRAAAEKGLGGGD